jgi:hypothetical protein
MLVVATFKSKSIIACCGFLRFHGLEASRYGWEGKGRYGWLDYWQGYWHAEVQEEKLCLTAESQ